MISKKTDSLARIFGLTAYEAQVYLALVEHGPATISTLSKTTNLPRTALYPPIKGLLLKGFIGVMVIGKRNNYSAVDLKRLKDILTQRTFELNGIIESYSEKDEIVSPKKDLGVIYFGGSNGIKTAGQLFLAETKQKLWLSFENLENIVNLVGIDFEQNYVQQRISKGIHSRMILSANVVSPAVKGFLTDDRKQLRETILISSHEYPFDSTIVVTAGLLLVINSKDNPFAVLIRNKYLAETISNIHKNIWDRYSG